MSANPIDVFAAQVSAREAGIIESAFRPERRTRARTHLRCPVLLLPGGGAKAIETVTQNLSSSGFYCLSPLPLTPGDSLFCTLRMPTYDPRGEEHMLALECRVRVMRAGADAEGAYGIACRIEDYRLVTSDIRTA